MATKTQYVTDYRKQSNNPETSRTTQRKEQPDTTKKETKRNSKITDGGFWFMFLLTLIAFTVATVFGSLGGVAIKIIAIIIIIAFILYDWNGMKRNKANEYAALLRNGKFSGTLFDKGDVFSHLSGTGTSALPYKTGTFIVKLKYSKVSMGNLDEAEGEISYTFEILPEDCEEIAKLTDGKMDLEVLKKVLAERLVVPTSQYIGFATRDLDIPNGWTFEEKTKNGAVANKIGFHLTGKDARYASGLPTPIYSNFIKLHIVQINMDAPDIKGKGYDAHKQLKELEQELLIQEKKAGVDANKEKQFWIRLDVAIKQFIALRGKEPDDQQFDQIKQEVVNRFTQDKGADTILIQGSSDINKSEYLARKSGNKEKPKPTTEL